MSATDNKSNLVYDKAKYHFRGNFPEALPIEQAYVHIGMYLGWVIERDLYSEFFLEESETQIIRFKRRELSCTVLSEIWDGHLGSELFSDQGNMFTYYYYGGGIYRKDYEKLLMKGDMPSLYYVEDSFENFGKLITRIDERFEEWERILG
jgi:hypothetical protein